MRKSMMKTASAGGLKTEEAAVCPLNSLATKSAEEVKSTLSFIHENCTGAFLINDFEEHIIGYDSNSNAVVYDVDAMVLHLAKHYYEQDLEDEVDELCTWEEYLEMAQSYVDTNIIGGLSMIPFDEERPKPILLMYL